MIRSDVAQLLTPGAELIETHISWVILEQDRVIKLKKPVDLGFLDFSTGALRKLACESELRLNRRLAPDVYLGLGEVRGGADGLHIGGAGEIIEHAVLMRRLPDHDRADIQLSRGRLGLEGLRRAATTLARFHAEAARSPEISAWGSAEAVRVSVEENFAQTRGYLPALSSPAEADELEAWQRCFLDAHVERFEARIADDRVCEGHGDLRLEHLYLDESGGCRFLDCVEFNPRLRCLDVASDVAFLAMDLGVHARVDLAERFLSLYAEASGDYGLFGMVDFYESYRAFIRGKLACFSLERADLGPEARARTEAQARRFFRLALASERRALLGPRVIVVAGKIASGKSSLASALAMRTGAVVINSDRTRKMMEGVEVTEHLFDAPGAGAYTEDRTEATYAELFRRAEAVLKSGRPVILDASFARQRHREGAREVARRLRVPFAFVECRVSRAEAMRRLEQRARDASAVSDGRPEIWDAVSATWEPVQFTPSEVLELPEDGSVDEAMARLEQRLPMWPPPVG